MPTAPLILSLGLDAGLFETLNGLRRRHFPPERNVIDAHVTLFHDLPGQSVETICETLAAAAGRTPAFDVTAASLRFIGKGVVVDLRAHPAIALRNEMAHRWTEWLTPQDRQRFSPHVTIQNKVDPATARRTFEALGRTWSPLEGRGERLELWHYRGGPWEPVRSFEFTGD